MCEYDFLILDEPTNHLDLFSCEALEQSLVDFPGSILLISHDRYLLDKVCGITLVFDKQVIKRFEGNVSEYLGRKSVPEQQEDLKTPDPEEEELLLETRITQVLSELSKHKPGDPAYEDLDKKYRELIQRKKQSRQGTSTTD
jgi:macrolide transport system ATP-binding/permease protein